MNNKIGIKENKHINHLTSEYPGPNKYEPGEFFNISNFTDITSIDIKSSNEEELIFHINGTDPSLVNALRRILISEIPTIAIENCIFYQNTSIVPDEVLAHRLGLIPIIADSNLFNYKSESEELTEFNHLLFKLHVICGKEPMSVYSNELKWIPQGNQISRLSNVKPVHNDILITKLRPGQEIEVELVCVKGIGKTHAKWSPVCTAYYRLLPDINLKTVIKGDRATTLKEICPMGVFDIEDSGKLFVKDSLKCTMCRECLNHDEFTGDAELSKLQNQYECKNFIFLFYIIHLKNYYF